MSFSKSQGKKEGGQQKQQVQQHQNRGTNNSGGNKKWGSNNNNTPRNNNNNNSNHSPTLNHDGIITQDPEVAKQMHDRMLYLLGNLTGTIVEVTVKDGSKFRGIFHGASTEGELGIALKLAQKIFDPSAPIDKNKTNPNPIKNTLLILSPELVEINAVDVDLTATEGSSDRNTFKTDTDISGKLDIRERELHKWAPADDENALGLLEGDLETSGGGSWDQFAANEKLFGLKTDFDEEMYTTALNRSAPGYKDREKRAVKIANEIQKTSVTNVHMLEERGIAIDDSGMDEEDLYGAVVREVNPNKYVPPALRKQLAQQQQQQPPATTKKEAKGNPLNKLITSDLPKAGGSNPSPIANLPTTRRESSTDKNSDSKTTTGEPKRIENEIATTFRQFAMIEKDKLHAKKQALQKKEKDGRLAELKMFHQTFKLNVPIPADLVPLLSKGKKSSDSKSSGSPDSKTTSPSTASVENKKHEPVAKKPTVASPAAKDKAAPATTTTTTTTAAPGANESSPTTSAASAGTNSFKFNVKASSFKPNPTAAAFVPGGSGGSTTASNEKPNQFFNGRPLKKGEPAEHLTMAEAISPSFVHKDVSPSSVGPTWPFGNKSYRVQFNQFAAYEEDMYQGYPSPNYGYAYPQYRYPQYVQGMPPMAVQQGPYMNPQFVQNVAPMPPNGAPPNVGYSPQMANVSPHGSPFPQGFPSPQRSPMVPQGMPPQVYQYQGGPMMMRYPPEMMQNNGGPPLMMQRPVMVEPMQQYSPHPQHDTPANDSGTETPPAN